VGTTEGATAYYPWLTSGSKVNDLQLPTFFGIFCSWCEDEDKRQSTDIHYRSFAGDAAFNWRMVFGMKYSPNEDLVSLDLA